MDSMVLRYDVLLLVQVLGAVILVGSLFYGGLSVITVFGGALVLVAIAGLALAAVFDQEESVELSTRDGDQSVLERDTKR
ncbi:hypothetical protein [Halostagnicola sp. A-GB9-2]|uniref:hypothetical protein n=1 Tax=Halostagnicola sp. A-GB9-2 TaxID=3048066 RepID=UPI0024BFDEF9|nr:hypothetical protein [Halostagnicola sp. A-GB9-2]MDJ1431948.1 hypothetical protein [Halostagnicola sp. A-GB9-2]